MKEQPYIEINGVKIDPEKIAERSISVAQIVDSVANGAGRDALIPLLDDEALAYWLEHTLNNTFPQHRGTYEWSLKYRLGPELIKRLKARGRL